MTIEGFRWRRRGNDASGLRRVVADAFPSLPVGEAVCGVVLRTFTGDSHGYMA